MTPTQYRTAIERLGLSQVRAAAFLGISDRQSRRFALGEASIPPCIDKLLRLMVRLNLKPEDV
jgi:transcriptional regulator with XRE-family HTH domain